MADGRQVMEDVYQVVGGVAGRLDSLGGTYSAGELGEMESAVASCTKWVKLCRGKVWLRSAEGTALAEGCLVTARDLTASLDNPTTAIDTAIDLSTQLESLARVIATKAQVIT